MRQEFNVKGLYSLIGQDLYEANQLTDQEDVIGAIVDVNVVLNPGLALVELTVYRNNGDNHFSMLPEESTLLVGNKCFMRMLNNAPMLYFIKPRKNEIADSDNE